MKTRTLMLVDGMNAFYRAFYAYKRLSWNDESVSVIYGMPSLLGDCIFRWRPDEVMVVWDGNRAEMRTDLLPSYKGDRSKNGKLIDWENLEMQKREVRKLLHSLGVKQILNKEAEADDMIYKMTRLALQKNNYDVKIISSDKDFNQLLTDDRVSIFNPSKDNMIHSGNVKEYFGYTAAQCVDYLSLVGDSSDHIPGYPGIGEKKAPIFLEKFGSIANFLDDKKNTFPGIDRAKLREVAKRNAMLINLEVFYSVNQDTLKTVFYKESNPKFDKKAFKEICTKFGLKRMLMDGFTDKFKALHG